MKNNSIIISAFTLFLIISFPDFTYGNSDGNNKKIHFGIKAGPINSGFRLHKPTGLALEFKDSFELKKNYGLNADIYSDIKLYKFIYYAPELRFLHMKLEANYTYNGYTDHHLYTSDIIELAPVAIKFISQRNSPLNFYFYGGAGLTWIVRSERLFSNQYKTDNYRITIQGSAPFIEGEVGIYYNIFKSLQLTGGLKYNYGDRPSPGGIPIHKDYRYGGAAMDYYYTALNFGLRF